MGQDQLFLALIFVAFAGVCLGFFAGFLIGYNKGLVDLSNKLNEEKE